MKIAIDLRSLSSGSVSGVENYILGLLEHMLPMDRQNQYILFYNSFGQGGYSMEHFHFVNSQIKRTKFPNKILNACLKLNLVNLEKFTGPIDCLFMPNLNQFNISAKTKLAVTVHDMSPVVTPEFYDLKRKIWHKFLNYRKSFYRADVIFAVSQHTKNDLLRLFNLPEQKIKVVYPGIDKKIFNPQIPKEKLREARNLFNLPGDYFLFLSTIEPRKNLANIIKAFDSLDSKTNLVIAGRKGWKYKQIFREIAKSKKLSKIKYLGYLEEEYKPAVIKLARALVYPSFYEGFGFVPLEAMALGVPTVASQVSALPEVAQTACLLVNPYQVSNIAKAMHEADQNPVLREMLVEKGRQIADKYNWEKTAQEVLQGLEGLNKSG